MFYSRREMYPGLEQQIGGFSKGVSIQLAGHNMAKRTYNWTCPKVL